MHDKHGEHIGRKAHGSFLTYSLTMPLTIGGLRGKAEPAESTPQDSGVVVWEWQMVRLGARKLCMSPRAVVCGGGGSFSLDSLLLVGSIHGRGHGTGRYLVFVDYGDGITVINI
jgi:hypothetical protein